MTHTEEPMDEPRAGMLAHVGEQPIPIVAIGASAGGLKAFMQLLEALPADTGMAFVLIQHLSPGHESLMPGILRSKTRMPVSQN
jgi:two-component system CheB/CheR fusion protein